MTLLEIILTIGHGFVAVYCLLYPLNELFKWAIELEEGDEDR